MAIYELEDRIYFDGGLPADIAEAQEDTSEQNLENSEQTENNSGTGDSDNTENVSIAPESPSSEEPGDNADNDSDKSSDDSSDSGDSNSQTDGLTDSQTDGLTDSQPDSIAAVLDAIDDTTITDDLLADHNFLIISADNENLDEITDSLNDNTTLIIYDSDDTFDSIIQQLKDELGDNKAVNIGILNNEKIIDNSEKCNDFLDDLKDLQYFDGELNVINTAEAVNSVNSESIEPVLNSLGEGGSKLSILSTDSNGNWEIEEETGSDSLTDYFLEDSDFLTTVNQQQSTNNEIVFINSSVMNVEEIVDDLSEDAEVVYLTSGEDGIQEITDYLADRTDIDTIRIVSHGNEGYFVLNGKIIDSDFLAENSEIFASWSEHLSDDADIMLYGCNVAATVEGKAFVNSLADLTGADIAAATFNTGGTEANWALDYNYGEIEAVQLSIDGYSYHLASRIVTSNADSGAGTLRQAISDVGEGEEITFNLSAGYETITLSSQLTITKSMTIDGDNSSGSGTDVTVKVTTTYAEHVANPALTASIYRVFNIDAPGSSAENPVAISNMTISGGDISSYGTATAGYGGSIFVQSGTVDLTSVIVSGSKATYGSGIDNRNGTLTITYSEISYNTASTAAAVYNDSSGVINIVNSIISNNESLYVIGGVGNYTGTVSITGSTISDNTATGYCGGIQNYGTLEITDSTISNNEATLGGGIYSQNGTITFSGTNIFDGNTASDSGDAIYVIGGTVKFSDSTLKFSEQNALYGSFDTGASTVIYNGGAQTVAAINYYTLSFTGSTADSTKTFANGITKVANEILITTSITLSGSTETGENSTVQVTEAGVTASRVFNINASGSSAENPVTISNMTINGGDISDYEGGAPTDANYGGSIYIAAGTVQLNTVTVSGSKASSGGGIYCAGNLTVQNSTISNNTALDDNSNDEVKPSGGGIYNASGTLTIRNSTISNNTAINSKIVSATTEAYGGGIYNLSGTVSVEDSTISDNTAKTLNSSDPRAYGGGIYSGGGALTVQNSTISGNTAEASNPTADVDAAAYGGGIAVDNSGDLYLYNSTVAYNTLISNHVTTGGQRLTSEGGGVYFVGNSATISNSTIAENIIEVPAVSANWWYHGSGVYFNNGVLTVRNSIIAENTYHGPMGTQGIVGDYYGNVTLTDGGYNVVKYQEYWLNHVWSPTYAFTAGTSILYNYTSGGATATGWNNNNGTEVSGSLGLSSTLEDNGGPTLTLSLANDSFAVGKLGNGIPSTNNWNNSPLIDGQYTDQRGVVRTSGQYTSIGAYSENFAPSLYYMAKSTGNWSTTGENNIWWTSTTGDEGTYTTQAADTPTATNAIKVFIGDGSSTNVTVTVDASISISQANVNTGSSLIIASGVTFTIVDTTGTDLTVSGSLSENGTGALVLASGTKVLYNGGNQTIAAADYYELQIANTTPGEATTKIFSDGITSVAQYISITDSIVFTGSSASAVTVQVTVPYDWDGSTFNANATHSGVFFICAEGKNVTISNMTIKGGDISSSEDYNFGGGICAAYVSSSVKLENVSIEGSKASRGGGIFNESSTLEIINSTISYNIATNDGGGILSQSDGTLTIENSTIAENKTESASGGGIHISGSNTISNSTIAHNTATNGNGGGIFFNNGTLAVRNTIIAENSNNDDYYYSSGTLTDSGYNVVEYQSGSLLNNKAFNKTTDILYNTEIGTKDSETSDVIVHSAWNQNKTDIAGTLGLSDTLADNGGPTLTLSLGSGSFAAASETTGIPSGNHWNNSPEIEGAYTDQRGVERTAGQNTSIGAYSANYTPALYYMAKDVAGQGTYNWDATNVWYTNTIGGTNPNDYTTLTETAPDANNSTGIIIYNNIAMTIVTGGFSIDQTTVNTGASITVSDGQTLTIADGDEATDFTNNGTVTVNGTLSLAGTVSGTAFAYGDSSTLEYSGATAQETSDVEFASSGIKNLTITNTAGVTLNGTKSISGDFTVADTYSFTTDAYTLIVDGTTSVAGTITVSASGALDADGSLTLSGTVNNSGTIYAESSVSITPASVGGTFVYNGSNQTVEGLSYTNLTLAGSGTVTVSDGTTVTGALSVTEDYTSNTITNSGTLTLSGTSSFGSITTVSGGTVDYAGSGQTVAGITYTNLTLSGSGTVTVSDGTNVGTALSATGSYTSNTITNSGTLTLNGTSNFTSVTIISGGTVVYAGAGQTVAGLTYTNLTLAGSGTVTVSDGTTVTGALSVTEDYTSNTITNSGTLTLSGTSSFGSITTVSGGTVDYAGSGQTVAGITYTNLTLSGSGTVTVSDGTNVGTALSATGSYTSNTITNSGTLTLNGTSSFGSITTISGGTVDYAGSGQTVAGLTYTNLTLSGSGTVTVSNGTNVGNALSVTGSYTSNTITNSGTLTLNGTSSFGSITTVSGGTVDYAGSGQTIAGLTYTNLTLSGDSTVTVSNGTNVDGAFSVTGTYTDSTITNEGTLSIGGTSSFGSITTVSGGTVTYNGAAQDIADVIYNNLTTSGSGTKTISGSLNVSGLLTHSGSGDFDTNGNNITANGLSVSNGTFNTEGADGSWDINGDITLTGGTLTATSETILFAGTNWTLDGGTFTANDGTVNFDRGTAQNILSGDIEFTNLTLATGTVLTTSQSVTVSGTTSGTGTVNATGGIFTYSRSGDQSIFSGTYNAITLSGSGTKTFSGSEGDVKTTIATAGITVDSNITVSGGGVGYTYVQADASSSAGAANRVFTIESDKTVTISNMTIRYGNVTGSGGGIYTTGTGSLTLNNITVSDCIASVNGDGIYSDSALTVTGTVDLNSSLYHNTSGNLTFADTSSVLKLAAASNTIKESLFFNGGATVEYDGNIDQAIVNLSYYNLTTSGSGTKTLASGTTTVENTLTTGADGFTIGSGNTLQIGSSNDGTGSWVNTATTVTTTGSTVNYGDTENQTVLNTNSDGVEYNVLRLSGSGSTKSFSGTTTVTGGITISSSLTVDGDGASTTFVQAAETAGTATSRVFSIESGTVTISDMTIRYGNITGNGGGIYNKGTLTLSNSTVSGNTATGDGGGIYNCYDTDMGEGGTISFISNSTISGNSAGTDGGGIFNNYKIDSISNTTISGNTANGKGGGIYTGGNAVSVAITDSTIANNHSDNDVETGSEKGGGIYLSGGTLTVSNTIIANNYIGSGTTGDDYYYSGGSLTDSGYNIVKIQDGSSNQFDNSADWIWNSSNSRYEKGGSSTTDYGLLYLDTALKANGTLNGTYTLSITSSDSIAAGNGYTALRFDQRGYYRGLIDGVTIGAYEYGGTAPVNGDYISVADGNWSATAVWETYDSSTGEWCAAVAAPDSSDNVIIAFGDTVTVDDAKEATELTIAYGGELTVGTESITVTENITIAGTLTISSGTVALGGDWNSSAGTFTAGNSTVIFNGSSMQSITSGNNSFYNVIVNNDSIGVKIFDNTTISNNLVLTDGAGLFDTNSNTLTVNGSIQDDSGGNNFDSDHMIIVNGTGKLHLPVAPNTSYLFPVGTYSEDKGYVYSPITIEFANGDFSGDDYVEVTAAPDKFAENPCEINYLSRYWNATSSGVVNYEATVTCYYDENDVVGTESGIYGAEYLNGSWIKTTAVDVNNHNFTLTAVTSLAVFTGIAAPYTASVVLTPSTPQTITAGNTRLFSAAAYDQYGNLITDTATDFTWINTTSAGLFNSTAAGLYTVNAAYTSVSSGNVTVTVEPGAVNTVSISPSASQTLTSGETVQFSASAYDLYENLITDTATNFTWINTTSAGLFNTTAPGHYLVIALYGNVTSTTVTVTVNAKPNPTRPDINNGEMINDGTETQTHTSWRTSIDSDIGTEDNYYFEVENDDLFNDVFTKTTAALSSLSNGEYGLTNTGASSSSSGISIGGTGLGNAYDGEYGIDANAGNMVNGEYGVGNSSGIEQKFDSGYDGIVDLTFNFESNTDLINHEAIAAYNERHPLFKTELDLLLEKI